MLLNLKNSFEERERESACTILFRNIIAFFQMVGTFTGFSKQIREMYQPMGGG
jgi:hypothetical protein